MSLEEYIGRIDDFLKLKSSEQIMYFGYFLVEHQGQESFVSRDIEKCFSELKLPAYSNIPAFLSKAKQAKRMLKHKTGGYILSKIESEIINATIGEAKIQRPSSDLFPLELLDEARKYLKQTAQQAILCYDNKLYDACLVMIRRLLETLIIELFERHNIKERIQNNGGNYFFCSELIDQLLSEKKLWVINRNSKNVLPEIKLKGDMSAHNRRYNATKSDIDAIKFGVRTVIEELMHLINYEQWYIESRTT